MPWVLGILAPHCFCNSLSCGYFYYGHILVVVELGPRCGGSYHARLMQAEEHVAIIAKELPRMRCYWILASGLSMVEGK